MKKNENYDVGCCFYIMKRLFLGILLVFFSIFNGQAQKKEVRVTLDVKGNSLQQVFKEITRQTGYKFVYSSSLLPENVKVKNETLERTLELCLKGTDLGFKVEESHVIISPRLPKEQNMNVTVYEGTVVDVNGDGVPGVTIVLKGTSQGVATNAEGRLKWLSPKEKIKCWCSLLSG